MYRMNYYNDNMNHWMFHKIIIIVWSDFDNDSWIVKHFEALTLHMYCYITIHSVNFVISLPSENLKKFEHSDMKRYNGWLTIIIIYCGKEHFPCKYMKKNEILNYNFIWIWSYIFIETSLTVLIICTWIHWSIHRILHKYLKENLLNLIIFCNTIKSKKSTTS
jgi:hypothetical protein